MSNERELYGKVDGCSTRKCKCFVFFDNYRDSKLLCIFELLAVV